MSLKGWLEYRWLEAHEANVEEISQLLALVDRDLKDADTDGLSADWRLSISYNAVLQLATLALAAEGYRPGKVRQHERTIQSLALTAGVGAKVVNTLDVIRRKRHQNNYDRAGTTSVKEADEIHEIARVLRITVLAWLRKRHPALLSQ